MNSIIWLLVALNNGGHSSPTVIAKFLEEKDCLVAVALLERKSKDNSKMAAISGICLPVTGTAK